MPKVYIYIYIHSHTHTHTSLWCESFVVLYRNGSPDVCIMRRHLSTWTYNAAMYKLLERISSRVFFTDLSSMIDMWKNNATNNARKKLPQMLVDALLLGLSAGLIFVCDVLNILDLLNMFKIIRFSREERWTPLFIFWVDMIRFGWERGDGAAHCFFWIPLDGLLRFTYIIWMQRMKRLGKQD